ncbi:MAG: NAD(P)H-hydrate dehydratase [Cellulosilyticaceae bacterium]
MKLTTKAQINAIDQEAIQDYKIPSILLMEHAAYSVFRYIDKQYETRQSITILCGPGNNGGDGLALARQLVIGAKHKVKVILLAIPQKLSLDGQTYYEMCKQMNVNIKEGYAFLKIQRALEGADIIVDALFGTGLTRPITGQYYNVIEWINSQDKTVISIDMPSGISADTGQVLGIAIKASVTISFALPKLGLYLYPGIDYVGRIMIKDIGVPKTILENCPSRIFAMDEIYAKAYLPRRYTRSNKGTYGKVLIIGGQSGMSGAVTLAGESCMRSGAGTVTIAVPKSISDILEINLTESMTITLPDDEGQLSVEAVPILRKLIEKYDVLAVGPGIGRSKAIEEILKVVLESNKPCVIDADGLYALKNHLEFLKTRTSPVVLTPHPGELAYLMDKSISDILENPLRISEEFIKQYPVTLVLKLERTIIKDAEKTFINTTGNNGLAKGGSGDVLTGIITALMGQNVPPNEAARLGVYIHGKAADKMIEEKSRYSLLPHDINNGIGKIFREIED